jgi:hypothetical protein
MVLHARVRKVSPRQSVTVSLQHRKWSILAGRCGSQRAVDMVQHCLACPRGILEAWRNLGSPTTRCSQAGQQARIPSGLWWGVVGLWLLRSFWLAAPGPTVGLDLPGRL